MIINKVLSVSQKLFSYFYEKSCLLKNIDKLIFFNILLVIFFSGFLSSDSIGYFALFAVILTAIKMMTKPREKFYLSSGDILLLVYFMLLVISVAGSSLFALSLKGFLKTLMYIGFYIAIVHYLKDNRKNLKYILMAVGAVVFAETLIAFRQNFLCVSEISGWQDVSHLNPEEVMTRVYGSLKPYNPNLFGGYMIAALPCTLIFTYLPLTNRHYKTSLLGFLVFILSVIAVIMTGCRGAYIGLFFELLILGVISYKLLSKFYKKLLVCICSFILSFAFTAVCFVSSLRARIFSIFSMRNDSSNSFRFNVYNSCVDMFKDNWLLGIGLGNQNFREIYGLYMKTGFDALSAYNIYLETAVESGIFSLLAFLGFLSINIGKALRYIFRRSNINVLYLVIALSSIAGMLVHGLVDTVFFRPQIQFIFWIMIGIIRVITVPKR